MEVMATVSILELTRQGRNRLPLGKVYCFKFLTKDVHESQRFNRKLK